MTLAAVLTSIQLFRSEWVVGADPPETWGIKLARSEITHGRASRGVSHSTSVSAEGRRKATTRKATTAESRICAPLTCRIPGARLYQAIENAYRYEMSRDKERWRATIPVQRRSGPGRGVDSADAIVELEHLGLPRLQSQAILPLTTRQTPAREFPRW